MHEWQSLSHVRWECKYHVVIIPKYRRKVFYRRLRHRIGPILRELCRQRGIKLLEGHAMHFLTGEHVERRTRVDPRRPLIPTNKGDHLGPGAWEVVGRVSALRLGESVFTAGFADPGLWSNSAVTTELGLNRYWNEYGKMYILGCTANSATRSSTAPVTSRRPPRCSG